MGSTYYIPKRTTIQRLRLITLALVLGATLSLPFACNLYGWLLGHHTTIGEPLLRLSVSESGYVQLLATLALIAAGIAWYFQKYRISGVFLLAGTLTVSLFFELVYNPFYLFWWLYAYHDISQLGQVHDKLLIISSLYYGFMLASFYVLFKRQPIKASGTFGTARLEEGDKMSQVKDGILLARHLSTGKFLRYNGEQHIVTFAPTGQGKGVGCIIPNLIMYPHNIIMIDPKGENCSYTWKRRQQLGQKIYCLDPFQVSSFGKKFGSDSINLLDMIPSRSKETRQLCSDLAEIIVPTKDADFWQLSANIIYKGMLQYICNAPEFNDPDHPDYSPELRHIGTISDLISLPTEEFFTYIKNISRASFLTLQEKKIANKILNSSKSMKMLMSILQTLDSNIEVLDDDHIRASVTRGNISFDEVLTKQATLYIVIPPDKIDGYRKWINMLLVSFLNRAVQLRSTVKENDTVSEILFMLDEFANLGRLDTIIRAYSLLRGYGFKFWIFLQDLPQLDSTYKKKWESFISNSGIRQVFNINDYKTADYVSKMMGETTIFVESSSESNKKSVVGLEDSSGGSQSVTERGRALKKPDELLTMDKDHQIILQAGSHPVEAVKLQYFSDPYFDGKYASKQEVEQMEKAPPEVEVDNRPDPHAESKLRAIIHSSYFLKGLYKNPHQDNDHQDSSDAASPDEGGKTELEPARDPSSQEQPTLETHGYSLVDDSPELSEDDVPDIEDF